MPQQIINNAESGLAVRTKINANFTELYDSKISGAGVRSMSVVTAMPSVPVSDILYIVVPPNATEASLVQLGNVVLVDNNAKATQTFNFDATTIPSLALWLDAADSNTLFDSAVGGSNVTVDGATIARWEDKSISNLDAIQNVENSKPILKKSIINGKNCIRMDGTNDFLTSQLSLNGLTTFTVYMVCKSSGLSSGLSLGYGIARDDGALLQSNSYGVGVVLQMSSVAGAGSISGSTALLKGLYKNSVIMSSYNDLQGTPVNSYNQYQNPGFIIQRLPTDIGAVRWANGSIFQNFGGDYCEILVFSSDLTPLQRQSVELYLNQKWAIF